MKRFLSWLYSRIFGSKLENRLLVETEENLKLLKKLYKRKEITETVYKTEIEKKLGLLRSLNKAYQDILNNKKPGGGLGV